MEEKQSTAKVLSGLVVGTAMQKTIKVEVERRVMHPIYRKYVKRTTRLLAHDENSECQNGDTVLIQECRPYSKRKAWRLIKIVKGTEKIALA